MTTKPTVFVLSHERPLFLWATLDSLYRNTRMDVRFVLLENGSKDPMVRDVISGFDRRGMFDRILWNSENDPRLIEKAFQESLADLGDRFSYCENDVVVPETVCWASEYENVYRNEPSVGMIGSFCDPRDFPDPGFVSKLFPDASDEQIVFLSKANSPERKFKIEPGMVTWPNPDQHPPGRLLWLSTTAVTQTGVHADHLLGEKMRATGYKTRVCTTFRHRHLSLLNAFDTNDETYAARRDSFFKSYGSDHWATLPSSVK